jgi:hypothetical protein
MPDGLHRDGAPPMRRKPQSLYLDARGREVTYNHWRQVPPNLPIIRRIEDLTLRLNRRIPARRTRDFDQQVNAVLQGHDFHRLASALRDLPEAIRPGRLTRLELLTFIFRLGRRLVREAA